MLFPCTLRCRLPAHVAFRLSLSYSIVLHHYSQPLTLFVVVFWLASRKISVPEHPVRQCLQFTLKPTHLVTVYDSSFQLTASVPHRPAALELGVVTMATTILNGVKKRPFLIAGGIAGCSVFFLVRDCEVGSLDASLLRTFLAEHRTPTLQQSQSSTTHFAQCCCKTPNSSA